MLLRLDPADGSPLYTQIAGAIRRAIADQELTEGDRLPPARELAAALDVNMHTVLHAFTELQDEGVVSMRRGRGTVIRDGGASRAAVFDLVSALVSESRRQGINKNDVLRLIEQEMS